MTKYREIIRLAQPNLKLSQEQIAASCNASKGTVNKVLKAAKEHQLTWPLPESYTDQVIAEKLFPEKKQRQVDSTRREPDYEYIRKELLRNGVNKKLLWTEYLETCRLSGDKPLMYSQFCYHIQQKLPDFQGFLAFTLFHFIDIVFISFSSRSRCAKAFTTSIERASTSVAS